MGANRVVARAGTYRKGQVEVFPQIDITKTHDRGKGEVIGISVGQVA